MAFGWSRKKKQTKGRPASSPDAAAGNASNAEPDPDLEAALEHALDAVADVLRVYGENSFDLEHAPAEETREHCELWARHALVGSAATPHHTRVETVDDDPEGLAPTIERPIPEVASEESPDEDAGPTRLPRDFRGLLHFFKRHRGEENVYVAGTLSDLRLAVWTMVQVLRSGMTEDRRADTLAADHLQRLSEAVESHSTAKIKSQATECVRVVSGLLEQRNQRQRDQISELAMQLAEMKSELERAWAETTRDPLTGLGNRAAFDEHVGRMLDVQFLFPEEPSYLMMIDVDHFKWVNDNFGHSVGDEVIKAVATSLDRSFPRKKDLVARYGGDEFAAVVRVENDEIAQRLADRALFNVRECGVERDGEPVRVSLSVGIARLEPEEEAADWLERADAALYRAKKLGRDRAILAEPPKAKPLKVKGPSSGSRKRPRPDRS